MTLDTIIEARRRRLLRDFATGFPPLVQVESPAALSLLGRVLDEFEGADGPSALGRRSLSNVIIMSGQGGGPDAASVWVRAGYGDYRGAFVRFLATVYGVADPRPGLAGHDVDHLLNRARAASAAGYLRIEAVPLAINRLWGSFLERAASSPLIARNRSERRLMSHLIAAKLAGIAPPASLDDAPGRDRIALLLSRYGLPRAEVRAGLDTMLAHIARNQP